MDNSVDRKNAIVSMICKVIIICIAISISGPRY